MAYLQDEKVSLDRSGEAGKTPHLSAPLPHHSPHPVGENSVEGETELIQGVMGTYIILELMERLSEFCFLAQACPGHCSIPMV